MRPDETKTPPHSGSVFRCFHPTRTWMDSPGEGVRMTGGVHRLNALDGNEPGAPRPIRQCLNGRQAGHLRFQRPCIGLQTVQPAFYVAQLKPLGGCRNHERHIRKAESEQKRPQHHVPAQVRLLHKPTAQGGRQPEAFMRPRHGECVNTGHMICFFVGWLFDVKPRNTKKSHPLTGGVQKAETGERITSVRQCAAWRCAHEDLMRPLRPRA